MAKKVHKPEEIVSKLRQVDVLHSQGMTMADAIRQISVSEVTFYRWRIVNDLEVIGMPTLLYRDGSLGDAKAIGQNLFRYFKSSAEVIRRAVTQDIR